jgi:cell shape-determining protein MreC
MPYPLRSKGDKTNRTKTLIIVGVFVFLSLFIFIFPGFSRSLTTTISRPLWFVTDGLARPFTGIVDFFKFKSSLVSSNLALEDENASLKLKQVDYDAILVENQDLKNQLGRPDKATRIFSRVLSKPPKSPYDTFLIDAGKGEGVVPGSKVYLSEKIVIGTIVSTTNGSSLVTLFSNSGHKQEVILSRTGASFVLSGLGGANFNVVVPKDADILWGDTFVYPDSSGSVLGSVYYIDTNSQSSFKTIYIRIPGNAFAAKYVFVEKAKQ